MIGKYLIFEPEWRGNFSEEWRQCLKQIIYRRETGFRLIKINVFADLPDYETYIKVRKEIGKTINNAFGEQSPVFNITVHPPQFEHALLLSGKMRSTLFISGTASVIGQDTMGIEYIEKQTVVTIDNINKLMDQKRIGPMIPDQDIEWGKLILLRVYVKNQHDFVKVKAICGEHFPEVPAIYIESDICRDNLLVEIEAEFLINN